MVNSTCRFEEATWMFEKVLGWCSNLTEPSLSQKNIAVLCSKTAQILLHALCTSVTTRCRTSGSVRAPTVEQAKGIHCIVRWCLTIVAKHESVLHQPVELCSSVKERKERSLSRPVEFTLMHVGWAGPLLSNLKTSACPNFLSSPPAWHKPTCVGAASTRLHLLSICGKRFMLTAAQRGFHMDPQAVDANNGSIYSLLLPRQLDAESTSAASSTAMLPRWLAVTSFRFKAPLCFGTWCTYSLPQLCSSGQVWGLHTRTGVCHDVFTQYCLVRWSCSCSSLYLLSTSVRLWAVINHSLFHLKRKCTRLVCSFFNSRTRSWICRSPSRG